MIILTYIFGVVATAKKVPPQSKPGAKIKDLTEAELESLGPKLASSPLKVTCVVKSA